MLRYAACLFLASALAFPAFALTSDPRNDFEASVYDLVDPEGAAPGEEWVRPSLPGADSGRMLIVPTAGPGHRQENRNALFAASDSSLAVDRSTVESDSLWTLPWSASANAPQLGAPLTSMGSATPSVVRATSIPLPPSLWMFATALAFALLFARRRVGFTGPRHKGKPKGRSPTP